MAKCCQCGNELTTGDCKDQLGVLCNKCITENQNRQNNQNNRWNYNIYGWVCPKCGSVYGPFIFECCRCNHPIPWTVTYTTDKTNGIS